MFKILPTSEIYEFSEEIQPSKNYKMWLNENVVNSFNDELDAMQQVIFKILSTERYQFEIYSWNYGIELNDLYGEPIDYVVVEIQRRIKDALFQDDRIIDVLNFEFELPERNKLRIWFEVKTIFGNLNEEIEVNV